MGAKGLVTGGSGFVGVALGALAEHRDLVARVWR